MAGISATNLRPHRRWDCFIKAVRPWFIGLKMKLAFLASVAACSAQGFCAVLYISFCQRQPELFGVSPFEAGTKLVALWRALRPLMASALLHLRVDKPDNSFSFGSFWSSETEAAIWMALLWSSGVQELYRRRGRRFTSNYLNGPRDPELWMAAHCRPLSGQRLVCAALQISDGQLCVRQKGTSYPL